MTNPDAQLSHAELSQGMMALALRMSGAAQELTKDPAEPLSPLALATIDAYTRAMAPARPAYMHPNAAAMDEDNATAVFAQVCAVRALSDALNATELKADGRRLAVAALLNELGTVQQVERAIADVRRMKIVRVPFNEGMGIMSKALTLAAHCAQQGLALPAEGIDFVKHAARLADQIMPDSIARTLAHIVPAATDARPQGYAVTGHDISATAQVVTEPVMLRATTPMPANTDSAARVNP